MQCATLNCMYSKYLSGNCSSMSYIRKNQLQEVIKRCRVFFWFRYTVCTIIEMYPLGWCRWFTVFYQDFSGPYAFELSYRLLWHTQICWSSGVTELSQARQKQGESWPRCWPLQEGLAQIAISSFLGWQDAAIAQLVESMSRWRKQVSVKKAWLGLINASGHIETCSGEIFNQVL